MCVKIWNRIQKAEFGLYFIDVNNTYACCLNCLNVRIPLTRVRYWCKIHDIFVQILDAAQGIGTNYTRREIYEV